MEYNIFARSTVGYKNKIKNKRSQDYMFFKEYSDCIIASVADGHGVNRCMFSHRGSEFASKACIEVLRHTFEEIKDLEYEEATKLLESRKYIYSIGEKIHSKWKSYARSHFIEKIPNVYKLDYVLYGTTMIGVLITKKFNLYLQIGDGNILEYEDGKFSIVNYNRKSKTRGVVNSMYLEDAPNYIQIEYIKNDENNKKSIVLFSDGYTNSFSSYNKLFSNTKNTIDNYNKNVFTREKIIKEYDRYLQHLTANKSKDDISIIYII